MNGRYYIGSTDNVERRLDEHNSGKSVYTSQSRPFELMYQQEYNSLAEARKVERKLKRMKSRIIIEKMIVDQNIRMH